MTERRRAGIVANMSERFYVNCPLRPGLVSVSGPEAHHLAVVCRIRPGDLVCLFNGDGHQYPARVTEASRRGVVLDVLGMESPRRELPHYLQVAAPLPKGDRGQFLVEKLTELGVSSFVPLRTRRSVVHPREGRLDKLERYVIEASKQCGRNVLMKIEPPMDWEEYAQRGDLPEVKILAHPGGRSPDSAHFPSLPGGLALAVGPEGGLAEEEVQLATAAGWQLVGLGPRILRVETAALVLVAWATLTSARPPGAT